MGSTVLTIVLIVVAVVLISLLVAAIYLFIKLIRLAKLIRSDLMPTSGKIAFWAGVVYAVFPLDLLPDPIYLDDIGVLAGTIAYVTHLVRKHQIVDRIKSAAASDQKRWQIQR